MNSSTEEVASSTQILNNITNKRIEEVGSLKFKIRNLSKKIESELDSFFVIIILWIQHVILIASKDFTAIRKYISE